jgi:hypothetical protein
VEEDLFMTIMPIVWCAKVVVATPMGKLFEIQS